MQKMQCAGMDGHSKEGPEKQLGSNVLWPEDWVRGWERTLQKGTDYCSHVCSQGLQSGFRVRVPA